LNVRRWLVRCE